MKLSCLNIYLIQVQRKLKVHGISIRKDEGL